MYFTLIDDQVDPTQNWGALCFGVKIAKF